MESSYVRSGNSLKIAAAGLREQFTHSCIKWACTCKEPFSIPNASSVWAGRKWKLMKILLSKYFTFEFSCSPCCICWSGARKKGDVSTRFHSPCKVSTLLLWLSISFVYLICLERKKDLKMVLIVTLDFWESWCYHQGIFMLLTRVSTWMFLNVAPRRTASEQGEI